MATCPTYELLRSESDGPRGRIALISAMLASDAPPPAATVRHLDRCLSCAACMSPCGAGVDYRRIIDGARAHVERTYRRPLGERLQRQLVLRVLTRRRLTALLLAAGRRFPARLIGALPARLRPFVTVARDLPVSTQAERPSGSGGDQGSLGSVFLVEGCVQAAVAPRINDAAERLYRRNRYAVARGVGARCCGALALHMGHPEEARRRAAEVISEIERLGIDRFAAVLSTASGCGAVMKEYGDLFKGTPLEARARRVAALVRDPVEMVASFAAPLKVEVATGFPVTVHEPCSLRFVQTASGSYTNILRRAGLDAAPARDGVRCCGSAGSYSILQPDIAGQLGERRAAQIAESEAPVVASGNIGCILHLGRYLSRRPVHAIELLDWINGGVQPPETDGWERWPRRPAVVEHAGGAIW